MAGSSPPVSPWSTPSSSARTAAVILENTVPYVASFTPFSDVPWLSVDPTAGVVAVGDAATLTVTADATGLEPGTLRRGGGGAEQRPDPQPIAARRHPRGDVGLTDRLEPGRVGLARRMKSQLSPLHRSFIEVGLMI